MEKVLVFHTILHQYRAFSRALGQGWTVPVLRQYREQHLARFRGRVVTQVTRARCWTDVLLSKLCTWMTLMKLLAAGITVCLMLVTFKHADIDSFFWSHYDSRKAGAIVPILQMGEPKHKVNCPRSQCQTGGWQSWDSKKVGLAWSCRGPESSHYRCLYSMSTRMCICQKDQDFPQEVILCPFKKGL